MATKISEYSATPASNTDLDGINLSENVMVPSDVNDALRMQMAHLKDLDTGASALTSPEFASATMTGDLNFGTNNKATFGSGNDLSVFHDGSASYIVDSGTGSLNIHGTDINLRDADGNSYINMSDNGTGGTVTIRHNTAVKLTTKTDGVLITGELQADSLDINGSADISGNATFADNGKAIFGASSDLQIYHDGSHSYVSDAGTGNLQLSTNGTAIKMLRGNGEVLGSFNIGGSVDLYHSNAKKFETTASGISVTGGIDFSSGILASNGSVQFVMDKDNNGGEVFVWGHNASNATTNELMRLTSAGTLGIGTVPNANSKLHVSGGRSYFASNSNAFATYLRYNDSTAGVFVGSPAANEFQVSASSGAARFKVDSDGRVGIGTTTPSSYGELAVYKASGNVEAAVVTGGANYATYRLQNNAQRYSMQIRTDQSNAFVIRDETASASRFVVDTSGNVGIGTASPDAFVELYKAGTSELMIGSNNGGTAQLSFYEGTSSVKEGFLKYDGASNNVVLGTSGAPNAVVVARDTGNLALNSVGSGDIAIFKTTANSGTGLYINSQTTNQIDLVGYDGSAANAVNIRAGGATGSGLILTALNDVGIGRSDPQNIVGNHGGGLVVRSAAGRAATTTLFAVQSSNSYSMIEHLHNGQLKLRNDSNTQTLIVDNAGNLTATGNVTAYSDERLKSDITTIDNALDKVTTMRGVTFTKDGEAGSGVIAQELEKIAPELVMEGEEYKSVAYGNLVGYLIEAVKELSAKVEALENGSSK